jgi:hypothetical protein
MICSNEILKERLQGRPQWRKSGTDEFIERMLNFNRWLKEHAATTNPPMTLYDNSHRSLQETTEDVARWIRERL